jgi:dTDP-4-dehydrorhamnose reductase
MAKKVEKKITENLEGGNTVSVVGTQFTNLTAAELLAKAKANVVERKRLAEENKELYRLYHDSKAQRKTSSTEEKIQALTAKLEALKNLKK